MIIAASVTSGYFSICLLPWTKSLSTGISTGAITSFSNQYWEKSSKIISSAGSQESATTRTSKSILGLLTQLYHIDNPIEVFSFLESYPFLVSLLVEAFVEIERFFSSFVGYLEMHTDPDYSSERQIILSIVTVLSVEQAQKQLAQFDEHWWLDELERAKGKLCIMLGFR